MVRCAGQDRWGIKVKPASDRSFMDVVSRFSFFVIHESAPYMRLYKVKNRRDCKRSPNGASWPRYLSNARKLYADDYTGSLTIGIAWDYSGEDTAS